MKIEKPKFKHAFYKTEFKVIKEGAEYELTVTPVAGATPGMAVCYFYTDSENPKYKRLRAYFKISR